MTHSSRVFRSLLSCRFLALQNRIRSFLAHLVAVIAVPRAHPSHKVDSESTLKKEGLPIAPGQVSANLPSWESCSGNVIEFGAVLVCPHYSQYSIEGVVKVLRPRRLARRPRWCAG